MSVNDLIYGSQKISHPQKPVGLLTASEAVPGDGRLWIHANHKIASTGGRTR